VGCCVVDVCRHCRHTQLKIVGEDAGEVNSMHVVLFSDQICGGLKNWKCKHRRNVLEANDPARALTHVTAEDSNETTAPATEKELANGRHVGSACKLSCFICRRCFADKESRRSQATVWWCRVCHMPLCKIDRSGTDGGRDMTCTQERLRSEEEPLMCIGVHRRGVQMPEEFFVDLHHRKSKRKRN